MELANINTFPVNHSELVVVYPRSDDPVLYQEAFRTWQLIRLPAGLGGEKNGVSALRMFSIVYASISGACPGTDLWIFPPTWSVDANGIVGYGRLLKT
jgi:hypothetical protein